jgi:hypothetical protein
MNHESRIAELIRAGDSQPVGIPDLDEIRRRGRRSRTLRRAGYAGGVAALAVVIGAPVVVQSASDDGGGSAVDVAGGPQVAPNDPPPASDPQFRIEYGLSDPLGPDDPGAEYVLSPSAAPEFDAALGEIVDLGHGLYGPYEPDRGRLWAQRTEMVSGEQRAYLFLGDRHNGHYYAGEDPTRRNIAEPGPWGSLSIRWFFVPTKPYGQNPDWERDDPFAALFTVYHGDGVASARWERADGSTVPLQSSTNVLPGSTVLWGRTAADDIDTTGTVRLYDHNGDQIAACTLAQCGVPWTDQSYGGSLP